MTFRNGDARWHGRRVLQDNGEAAILPFRRPERLCIDCGIAYVGRHAWHRRCTQCHRWAVIGISIARMKRLLEGAR
jgi:hypothetical protein